MAPNRLNARWLRATLVTLALSGLALLGGCGGGSGAPNNPFAPKPVPPGPILILPPTLSVYSGTPASLTVTGGTPPYFVTSSNPTVLPLASAESTGVVVLLPGGVTAATAAVITVTDTVGVQGTASVTVNPAPIFNTLTVTPAAATCGVNAICSGQTATAAVTVLGPAGAPIPGRLVRFDVVSGAFAIESNDIGTPLVLTLTVPSDQFGHAQAIIQATAGAATQPGLLRATEITTGEQQTTQFTIVQSTLGTGVLSVVPAIATITGAFVNQCSSGFQTDYYVYGGTPPYTVASTFPAAVTVTNTPVTASGRAFSAITNGTCVNPLIFTIRDSAGLQIQAQLQNLAGTATPPGPTPPPALAIAPTFYTQPGCSSSTTFTFIVSGGTPPYNVSSTTGSAAKVLPSSGSTYTATWPGGTGTGAVVAVDSGSPQQSVSASITCT